MKVKFGLFNHTAELAIELNLSSEKDKEDMIKIINGIPVITIEHFIAPINNLIAAAGVVDNGQLKYAFIGKWEFQFTKKKPLLANYFKFTPLYEVKPLFVYMLNEFPDDYYLVYTHKNYKRLDTPSNIAFGQEENNEK